MSTLIRIGPLAVAECQITHDAGLVCQRPKAHKGKHLTRVLVVHTPTIYEWQEQDGDVYRGALVSLYARANVDPEEMACGICDFRGSAHGDGFEDTESCPSPEYTPDDCKGLFVWDMGEFAHCRRLPLHCNPPIETEADPCMVEHANGFTCDQIGVHEIHRFKYNEKEVWWAIPHESGLWATEEEANEHDYTCTIQRREKWTS